MSKNKMTKHLFLMNMIIVLTLLCGIAGSVFVYQKHREYLFYNDARILLADELKLIGDCYTGDVFDAEAFERGRSAEPDYKLVVVNTEGTVLYSEELPQTPQQLQAPPPGRRSIPASVSWVPSCAGLMLAGYVVQELIKDTENAK